MEKQARAIYGVPIEGKSSEFRMMMMKDGCFFLHLAFMILGKFKSLGYPEYDPDFGKKPSKRKKRKWIESMLFVGNQIPFVVLRELVQEKFFQDVIEKEKLSEMVPFGLCERVLHELLIFKPKKDGQPAQPYDLLNALHALLVNSVQLVPPAPVPIDEEDEDEFDLEANEYYDDVIGNQGIAFPSATDHNDKNNTLTVDSLRSLLKEFVTGSATDDHKRIFPSATELKQSGIHVRKLPNGGGIASIDFQKKIYFRAHVHLPTLPVDATTEIILRNLKAYESCHQSWIRKREVGSFLQLMSDLIQTPEDVKLLKEHKVIEESTEFAEPEIFSRLSSDSTTLTHNLREMRRKIVEYSSPLVHYRYILDFVAILTVLQAFFAVLAYFKPPKQ